MSNSRYISSFESHGVLSMEELIERIENYTIHNNTTHGYGVGLIPQWAPSFKDIPLTDLNPFYNAFGCSSANFLYDEHPAEVYINSVGAYSSILGATQDWGESKSFFYNFYKAYFQYGYDRIGDMLLWAAAQKQGPINVMTLLGDPYLMIVSNQFSTAPRIYVDSDLGKYSRFYNLDEAEGSIDDITIPIYSFNNAKWQIDNITYSDSLLAAHIDFSPASSGDNETVHMKFIDVDSIPAAEHSIGFDISDISDEYLPVKHIEVSLKVDNTNILDESDFIYDGQKKILPPGFYVLGKDVIIENGKTFIIQPGTTIETNWQFGTDWKIIIESDAKIKAIGTVENPIEIRGEGGSIFTMEINGDETPEDHGEFTYCLLGTQIIGIDTPNLKFDNCTFLPTMGSPLFPNPVKGEMKNSVMCRGQMSWPANGGYLSDLKVSYSIVPRSYRQEGEGILWDYEGLDWENRPTSTSLCINSGDPNDPKDPDGTRKDIGAYYYSLNNAIRVPEDYTTIQQALDSAEEAEIPVVMVSEGTYQENIKLPSGVRLMGASENNKPVLLGTASSDNLIETRPGNGQMRYLLENFIVTKQGQNKTGRALSIGEYQSQLFVLKNVAFKASHNNETLLYVLGDIYLDKVHFTDNTNNGRLFDFNPVFKMLENWMKDCSFKNNSNNEYLLFFNFEEFNGALLLSNIIFEENTNSTLWVNNAPMPVLEPEIYPLMVEKTVFYDNECIGLQSFGFGKTSIDNSTFYNNGFASAMDINIKDNSELKIHNSILWNNNVTFTKADTATLQVQYSDINSPHPGEEVGNINQDPIFVSESERNFRLQAGSPCIDTGDPDSPVPINGGSRIDMGAFEFIQDATPPLTPVVTDEGETTTNYSQLSAWWESDDPETGIIGYEYRITQDDPVDGEVVKDWTSIQVNRTTVYALELLVGKVYYFGVKAQNGAGQWSEVGYSDGITIESTNRAPELEPIGNPEIFEGDLLEISVNATDPDGDSLEYSASGLPDGAEFNPNTQILHWRPEYNQSGSCEIAFMVSDGELNDSETITVTVYNVETPWQDNDEDRKSINRRWNYTMGYRFTPVKDGKIIKLGGYFNGDKQVYLWDSSGNLLASTTVSSKNNWAYTSIAPVEVKTGEVYTVGVYLAGSGGVRGYRLKKRFPHTFGNIVIKGSCWKYGKFFPNYKYLSKKKMYGQVDIGFVPGETSKENTPPIAKDDSYTTEKGKALEVSAPGVLSNDSDEDGDALTVVKVSDPENGSVTLKADGSFTYTPNADFVGTDSFTYKASDGIAQSNVATVAIKVTNTAPVAEEDNYTTEKGKALEVSAPGVLSNDSDEDGDEVFSNWTYPDLVDSI